MTGLEALKLLTNGKKVRRAAWLPRVYAVRTGNDIVTFRDYIRMPTTFQPTQLRVSQLLEDDWELWEVVE